MATEQLVPIELDDDVRVVVLADRVGPVLVADEDVVARLSKVTDSIERVSREVLAAARRAAPTKATVELGFSLAIEQGQLIALFGKGKGEASITVTLEWSATEDREATPSGGVAS